MIKTMQHNFVFALLYLNQSSDTHIWYVTHNWNKKYIYIRMCYCDTKQIKINNTCTTTYNYNANSFKYLTSFHILLCMRRDEILVWKIKFHINNSYNFFLKLLINIEIITFCYVDETLKYALWIWVEILTN